jgi:hypothetical protein
MIYSAFGTDYDRYPEGEGQVARALEEQLSHWHHIHSRHFINIDRGVGRRKGGYGEGESDFVTIVPGWGFLVVECKAHSQVRIEGGVWQWQGRNGWEPFGKGQHPRPPIAQAWGNMHDIRKCLEEALGREIARTFRCAYAVCFPNLECHLRFGNQADKSRWGIDGTFLPFTIDRSWLPKIGDVLKRLVEQLPPVSGCNTDEILNFLAPTYYFETTTQDRIFRLGQDLAVLTERQYEAVRGTLVARTARHLITGPAGTGKTVVARRIATELAKGADGPILLLCFSSNLAQETAESLAGQNVRCNTVHSYFKALCVAAHEPLPPEFSDAFFDHDIARIAVNAARKLGVPHGQVCIVDECQDLTSSHLTALRFLSPRKLVLLGDIQQDIFVHGAAEQFRDFNEYCLTQNCRNPREIAGCVCAVAGISPNTVGVARCPKADRVPRILCTDTNESTAVRRVEKTLDEWMTLDGISPRRIAVLTSRRPEETPLGRAASRIGWLKFTESYHEWKRREDSVYFGTVHGFKGLDADAVLLHDVPMPGPNEFGFGLPHVYVGISRSCFELVVQPRDSEAHQWYTDRLEAGLRLAD